MIGHTQRAGKLGPIPAHDVVVRGRLAVDGPFDRVTIVVDHHDDRGQPFAGERAEFLHGQLCGPVADQQHRTAVRMRNRGPDCRGQRVTD